MFCSPVLPGVMTPPFPLESGARRKSRPATSSTATRGAVFAKLGGDSAPPLSVRPGLGNEAEEEEEKAGEKSPPDAPANPPRVVGLTGTPPGLAADADEEAAAEELDEEEDEDGEIAAEPPLCLPPTKATIPPPKDDEDDAEDVELLTRVSPAISVVRGRTPWGVTEKTGTVAGPLPKDFLAPLPPTPPPRAPQKPQ